MFDLQSARNVRGDGMIECFGLTELLSRNCTHLKLRVCLAKSWTKFVCDVQVMSHTNNVFELTSVDPVKRVALGSTSAYDSETSQDESAGTGRSHF